MRKSLTKVQQKRITRAMRVRKRLKGTSLKPRLSVFKSNNHLQVQLIDDDNSVTLAGISTSSKELRDTEFNRKSKASARKLGEYIAEKAKLQSIKEVVFDRGPYKYTGLLAELAEAARNAGLKF
ncbi:MAG: 50S ribosomal protein L18 [Parachlamydiaceae bacterium]|nr:50S ribosomal protein L18 [Parachlamydiaceae bacterium]